jgi:hypothetical protein
MHKNFLSYGHFGWLILIPLLLLFGCASTITCKAPPPVQLDPSLSQPAPPPLSFSKCLLEIIAVGEGKQGQISSQCSALLRPEPTP